VKNEEEEYDVEELAEPWHRYRIQDNPKTTDDQYVLYPVRLEVARLSGWPWTCETRRMWPLKL
jgi:hypothetical protein